MTEQPQNYFDSDPKVAAMRQNIADRAYSLKMKSMLITGGLAIAGIAAAFLAPAAMSFLPLVLLGGSGITSLLFMKEQEKLDIDRQQLESHIQGGKWGKGNWSAYREEVLQHGYNQSGGLTPPPHFGAPMHQPAAARG